MKTEKSQTYTPEFRETSVKLALESDKPIKETAEGLGVKPSTLHTWIGKYTRLLIEMIKILFQKGRGFYGTRRIKRKLAEQGKSVSRRRIARLHHEQVR